MSFVGYATARPPRIIIANIRTGEGYEMPFTPQTFKEAVSVNYARQQIVGMSHEILQYGNTGNYAIQDIEFFFRGTSKAEVNNIHDGRLFLLSLCYPPEGADSIRNGGPPRVLFSWPQVVSLTCVLTSLAIEHEQFNVEGRTTVFRATMSLEEIRDVRLVSEDVRVAGTRRPSAAAQEIRRY